MRWIIAFLVGVAFFMSRPTIHWEKPEREVATFIPVGKLPVGVPIARGK